MFVDDDFWLSAFGGGEDGGGYSDAVCAFNPCAIPKKVFEKKRVKLSVAKETIDFGEFGFGFLGNIAASPVG